MTEKFFWQDPYITSLDTQVQSVDGDKITVKETIFFAFAGGQESDSGTIADYPVLSAEKIRNSIVYTLPENHGLQVGDTVHMMIDWERRYKLMRLHFAAEIILELTYRTLDGIEKIGAHIAEDKSRIDFEWAQNIKPAFPQLITEATTLIDANHPIISDFSDRENRENERRYWEIEGFGKVACGGTHLRRTGEVGNLSLKRKNIGKGKERIEIYID